MREFAPGRLPAWVDAFPELARIADPAWIEVAGRARQLVLPAGTEMFREGDGWKHYLFVTEGVVRVYKSFENGRELVLYRVHGGETCCMTTSVLFGGGRFPANGVTETQTRAAVMQARDFRQAFRSSEGFRNFVCATLGRRIGDFVTLLESVTMRQVDVRLARWLVSHSDATDSVDVSHRELACELGTAREVISRHLKEFESRGWVGLGRKNIEIVDAPAIQAFAYS
jgi:CRP/FNR family transcriptional regulator